MPRRDVKPHHSPAHTTPWTQDYRFNWSRVSLSSATALTTTEWKRIPCPCFYRKPSLFNRLLTMLKQLAMEITALVCLPCSDVFLSAESLWQNWLEFANMFELPWNIIYGSTWHFPKYDMMMIRVIITAVIAQVTLPVFSYFFFCITFLCLPFTCWLHIILYTFFYLFCFVLSTAKRDGALMALYILRCADSFLFCLG